MTFIINWLAHPRLVFWLLPYLMALLVIGTLRQPDIGLYAAQEHYFASWILWAGPLPLPGMYPVLALLSLGLLVKVMFKSPWHRASAGNIAAHMGAILLMLGGLLTALTAEEGFIALSRGEQTAEVTDYLTRELVVLQSGEPIFRRRVSKLAAGQQINAPALPFSIEIESLCANCIPEMREAANPVNRGLAANVLLKSATPSKQPEANQSGAQIRIAGAGEQADGRYILFEPMPQMVQFSSGGTMYRIMVRKLRRALPFSVELQRFIVTRYPGSEKAKEYESRVMIHEPGGIEWPALIRMNEPLRVMGYTLYQSSFAEIGDQTQSVLSVVKNEGRVFPYIASLTIALGLTYHAWWRLRRGRMS